MSDLPEMATATSDDSHALDGAAICPSCSTLCEFELPASEGKFDIACFDCAHVFEIDANDAITLATEEEIAEDDKHDDDADDSGLVSVTCMKCAQDIMLDPASLEDPDFVPDCPHCLADEDLLNQPTRFDQMPLPAGPSSGQGRSGIILVSILSFGLVVSAMMVALGLYFLTLRNDSDVARYIETNILQLAPARFDVQSASYEVSETDIGTSLLVTITLTNSGQVEGTPEEMKVVLTDAQNQPLVTWPLDTAGQIIAPGQSTQLYTRLFEPPENFAQLRVLVR